MSEDNSGLLQSARQPEITVEKITVNTDFRDSRFFTGPGSPLRRLPTPSEVRAAARAAQQSQNFEHPSPVIFTSLGLLVKYGGGVRVAEAKCLRFIHQHLSGHVRVPEVYGWRTDARQTFIYMELIEGNTLENLWPTMNEEDRTAICSQLRLMVEEWRRLRQDETFLGMTLNSSSSATVSPFRSLLISNLQGALKTGLYLPDRIFEGAPETAGPFQSVSKFHDWYTTAIGPNKFDWKGKKPNPYRIKFPDNVPIVAIDCRHMS
jgi:hypothetical protein